jgi:hypothetical protein
MGFADMLVTIRIDNPEEGLLQLEIALDAPHHYGGVFVNFFPVRKSVTLLRISKGDVAPGTRVVFSIYEALLPQREIAVTVEIADELFRIEFSPGPIKIMLWCTGISAVIACIALRRVFLCRKMASGDSSESIGLELMQEMHGGRYRRGR